MSVTMVQIAEKTGLSVAAVSKALSDRPDIASSTKRRVRGVAQEMGYVMNVAARTLIMKKAMAIGVVLPLPHIPTVTERLRGIQSAALERNYLTTVAFHSGAAEEERRQIEMLYGRVDGLVITPANQSPELVKLLRQINLPIVCMSEPLVGMETDFVGDDDAEGGRLAAVHLVEIGRRRVAYLGCDPQIPSDQAFLRSLRSVMEGPGFAMEEALICWGNATEASARQNVDKLLDLRSRPEAIMAFSDITAMWALQRLEERGIVVPREVAVVGYDNTEFAALARVPLTSVAQPNFEIGQQAARVLLDRLTGQNGSAPCRRVIFNPTLVVRASSQFSCAQSQRDSARRADVSSG